MGPLWAGERRRGQLWVGRDTLLHLHVHALMTKELYAGSPVDPTTPILPEQRKRTDNQRMQEHAHLARLLGGGAIPLTLLAQRARATTADAGSIHDTQAPIGFSALFMREQLLVSGALQRPIRLESEVLA